MTGSFRGGPQAKALPKAQWPGRWNEGGHRITAAGAPGMAAQQASGAQVGACACTMGFKRGQRIGRTGRLETTHRTQPGAEHQPIELDHPDQRPLDGGAGGAWCSLTVHRGLRAIAAAINIASSSLAALASRSEAALMNSLRSNGVRSRTTHKPGASAAAVVATAARMRRLSNVRVTARLACRFGTTRPSQRPVPGNSSTGRESTGVVAVDKFAAPGAKTTFPPAEGRRGKW